MIASTRVLLAILIIILGFYTELAAAPIAVRLVEGTAHGLLLVRSISGEILGHGDFLQVVHPDRISETALSPTIRRRGIV